MEPPVARILIEMYADGGVSARGSVPSRSALNAMITTAWQDLLGSFREKEQKLRNNEAILQPPEGFKPGVSRG